MQPLPRLLAKLLLSTLLCIAGSAGAAGELVPWTGGATPALSLKDLSGKSVDLASYKGRAVLVNFWATWCAPCIAEMPAMQQLRDRIGAAKFDVVAVNYQEGVPRINEFLKKRPLQLTIVRDSDGTARTAWGVKVFPTSFLVDADGRIRYSIQGDADWASSNVEARIRELLAKG
jgi:thiol-disulfide isomerase/thioredoxin